MKDRGIPFQDSPFFKFTFSTDYIINAQSPDSVLKMGNRNIFFKQHMAGF